MLDTKVERRAARDRSQCGGGDQEKGSILERLEPGASVRNWEIREECDSELHQGEYDPDAEGEHDDCVFRVVSGLNRVIPVIKQLQQRTNEACQQDDCDNHTLCVPLHRSYASTYA